MAQSTRLKPPSKAAPVKATGSKSVASVVPTRHVKPTKQQREENEYFQLNALLVSSLLPYIPADERVTVQKWMQKLYRMGATEAERKTRNDYVWFLLVQLESGVVTLPFVKNPPKGTLGPVGKCVEKKLYDKVLEAANNKSAFVDEPPPREAPTAAGAVPGAAENTKYCRPSEFHDMQPKPKMGFIAYGSCFSDQLNYYHVTQT